MAHRSSKDETKEKIKSESSYIELLILNRKKQYGEDEVTAEFENKLNNMRQYSSIDTLQEHKRQLQEEILIDFFNQEVKHDKRVDPLFIIGFPPPLSVYEKLKIIQAVRTKNKDLPFEKLVYNTKNQENSFLDFYQEYCVGRIKELKEEISSYTKKIKIQENNLENGKKTRETEKKACEKFIDEMPGILDHLEKNVATSTEIQKQLSNLNKALTKIQGDEKLTIRQKYFKTMRQVSSVHNQIAESDSKKLSVKLFSFTGRTGSKVLPLLAEVLNESLNNSDILIKPLQIENKKRIFTEKDLYPNAYPTKEGLKEDWDEKIFRVQRDITRLKEERQPLEQELHAHEKHFHYISKYLRLQNALIGEIKANKPASPKVVELIREWAKDLSFDEQKNIVQAVRETFKDKSCVEAAYNSNKEKNIFYYFYTDYLKQYIPNLDDKLRAPYKPFYHSIIGDISNIQIKTAPGTPIHKQLEALKQKAQAVMENENLTDQGKYFLIINRLGKLNNQIVKEGENPRLATALAGIINYWLENKNIPTKVGKMVSKKDGQIFKLLPFVLADKNIKEAEKMKKELHVLEGKTPLKHPEYTTAAIVVDVLNIQPKTSHPLHNQLSELAENISTILMNDTLTGQDKYFIAMDMISQLQSKANQQGDTRTAKALQDLTQFMAEKKEVPFHAIASNNKEPKKTEDAKEKKIEEEAKRPRIKTNPKR